MRFLESFNISKPGEFINGGILVELFAFRIPYNAGSGNMLNIDLNALARMGHLFIRLWDVFRIGRFDRKALKTFQNTPQPSNRTRVTALTELHPENNEGQHGDFCAAYRGLT